MFTINEWISVYEEIAKLLSISKESDLEATYLLANMLKNMDLEKIHAIVKNRFTNKNILLFAAGPTLTIYAEKILKYFINSVSRDSIALVAVDGVAKYFRELDVVPDAIVTDLDGDVNSILYYGEKYNTIVFVHAHGDNMDKLKKVVPKLLKTRAYIVGTTQVKPVEPLMNYTGFTDGDRALSTVLYYNPKRVIMVGMDFGYKIGKYSKPLNRGQVIDLEKKIIKLQIAYKLVNEFSCRTKTPIYTLSPSTLNCVVNISLNEVPMLLK